MKRKLEPPKIVIYENVQRIENILSEYIDYDDANLEDIAKDILVEFKIPYGKKKVIELFENNVSAEIINDKVEIVAK